MIDPVLECQKPCYLRELTVAGQDEVIKCKQEIWRAIKAIKIALFAQQCENGRVCRQTECSGGAEDLLFRLYYAWSVMIMIQLTLCFPGMFTNWICVKGHIF